MSTDLRNGFSCWYPLWGSWGSPTRGVSITATMAPGEHRLWAEQAHMGADIHMGWSVKMASLNTLNMSIIIISQ